MTKTVYMTIDDGPLKGMSNILSVADSLSVPISLFLVGLHVETGGNSKQLTEKAKSDKNILVCNHSYCHANNHYKDYYSNPEGVLRDFLHNREILGNDNGIARLPGRNMWEVGARSKYDIESGQSSAVLLHKNGYTVFGWDIEWQHESSGEPIQSVNDMLAQIENKLNNNAVFTKDHIVVLAHDQMFGGQDEREQLTELMSGLKNKGYILDLVNNYPR